jgi:hypothetical protein
LGRNLHINAKWYQIIILTLMRNVVNSGEYSTIKKNNSIRTSNWIW